MFNDYMHSVFRKNGPTHAIVESSGGDTKTIYTIEPENIKTMLHTNFSDYHRSRNMPNALDPVMGQGIFRVMIRGHHISTKKHHYSF